MTRLTCHIGCHLRRSTEDPDDPRLLLAAIVFCSYPSSTRRPVRSVKDTAPFESVALAGHTHSGAAGAVAANRAASATQEKNLRVNVFILHRLKANILKANLLNWVREYCWY